ncbi:MAG: HIT family protein [Candidatus Paceibacterota bacterium]
MTVNSDNARGQEQRKELENIKKKGFCPFCDRTYIEKEHKKPILIETDHWLVTENRWPYAHARIHLLLIHKDHIITLADMSLGAWNDLHGLLSKIPTVVDLPGGAFMMRFGDTRYTGGTVDHLHAQIISGSPAQDSPPVMARVG